MGRNFETGKFNLAPCPKQVSTKTSDFFEFDAIPSQVVVYESFVDVAFCELSLETG